MHYPCGKCAACRVNHINQWIARGILEWHQYPEAKMVTLTLDDKKLSPEGYEPHGRDPEKRHAQLFLKRLRKNIRQIDPDHQIRYFMVSEYGKGPTKRAHYHAIIYNFPQDFYSRWHKGPFHQALEKAWPYGFVKSDRLESAGGIAYVMKYLFKQARGDDSEFFHSENCPKNDPWLIGRRNTFYLASRVPPLGVGMAPQIVDAYLKYGALNRDNTRFAPFHNDIMRGIIRLENRFYPLGKQVMKACREEMLKRKLHNMVSVMDNNIWELSKDYARWENTVKHIETERRYYADLEPERWEKSIKDEERSKRFLRKHGVL